MAGDILEIHRGLSVADTHDRNQAIPNRGHFETAQQIRNMFWVTFVDIEQHLIGVTVIAGW